MTKYEPLRTFLAHSGSGEVPMRFSEIERIIGAPLPPAAFKHRAWWSNNPQNSVITLAWLDAGYKTERVDMAARRLVFRRDQSAPTQPLPGGGDSVLAKLRRSLGGTVRVAETVDLTAPAGADWDADR